MSKEKREVVDDLPDTFGRMPDWVVKQREAELSRRITALLPKIQECATLRKEYDAEYEMFRTFLEWDLPKLRQVLKEGL